MPSCAFRKCFNHSGKKNKTHMITFHSFPKDEFIRQKWVTILRKQRQERDWVPTIHSRICSIHFKAQDIYKTDKDLIRLSKGAVPYDQAASATSQKKQRFDPLKEYANDSTDEESSDTKQEKTDEETSDDNISKSGASVTDRVFVKSIAYKKKQCEDGQKKSKRARLHSSESPLDYTEELYEFGKFIAEQLMCLDVEDARVAQAEIRALLSKFDLTKEIRCKEEPSTSHAQSMTEDACTVTRVYPTVSVSAVTKPSTNRTETTNKTAEPRKQATRTASKVNSAGLSTKSGSKMNTTGSLYQPGSQVNVDGPLETQTESLLKEVVINVNPASSLASGYVIVPAVVTGSGVRNTEKTETQSGSLTMIFNETTIKIEAESESLHSHVNITPSVTDLESLVIKYEPDSGDETWFV